MAFSSVLGEIDLGGFQLGEIAVGGISPDSIASAESFGTLTIAGPVNPSSIASAEAFGALVVAGGAATVFADSIASVESFGSPTVSLSSMLTIFPGTIASGESFGTLTVSLNIRPVSIPTAESFGTPTVLRVTGVGTLGYALYLSSVDKTAYLRDSTLLVQLNMNGTGTASANLLSDGTYRPQVGQPIEFWMGATRRFAGLIQEVEESNENQTPLFYFALSCGDFTSILERRYIFAKYQNTTLSFIVYDIISKYLAADGFSLGTISTSVSMAANDVLEFDGPTIREACGRLGEFFQADFRVDFDKRLHFTDASSVTAAPYNLTDGDGTARDNSITVRTSLNNYANRVLLKSSTGIAPLWCDTITGTRSVIANNVLDSSQQFFITRYTIASKPRVRVDGVEQTVVELSDIGSSAYDWYYIADGFGVQQKFSTTPLNSGQELEICYVAGPANVQTGQDDAAIAARQAVEGGSGIYEAVLNVPDLPSQEAADKIIAGVLARRGIVSRTVKFASDRQGWEPGQTMTINLAKPLVPTDDFQIESVAFGDIDSSLRAAGGAFLRYTSIVAVNGAALGTPERFYRKLIDGVNKDKDRVLEMVVFHLQDGLVAAISTATNVGKNPGEWQSDVIIREARVSIDDTEAAPDGNVTFDIVMNGSSIFGATKLILLSGDRSATQPFFVTDLVYAAKGSKLRLDVSGTITVGGPATVTLTALRR